MLFQILYIHLFRRFLNYDPTNSPLPANVSPRKYCTTAAATISKLLRLYKRSYGLRQICNIVVYIAHSACTIHLLNLPEKNAKRDITHGVKQLEEIAEGWLCARRTLRVISVQARRWNIELPEEAATVLARTNAKFARTPKHTPNGTPAPQRFQTQPVVVSQPSATAEQEAWNQPLDFDQFNASGLDLSSYGIDDDNSAFSSAPSQPMSHVQTSSISSSTAPLSRSNTGMSGSSGSTPYFSNQQQIDEFLDSQAQQPPPVTSTSSYNSPDSLHGHPKQPSQQFPSLATSAPSFNLPAQSSSQAQLFPSYQNTSMSMRGPLPNHSMSFQTPDLPHQTQRQPFQPHRASALPPQDTQAMQRPSQQPTSAPSSRARPQKRSPSDRMFGGVEALLQDSEEFWVNDQQEVAHGFGRWGLGGAGVAGGRNG